MLTGLFDTSRRRAPTDALATLIDGSRPLLDTLQSAIVLADVDLVVVYVNPVAAAALAAIDRPMRDAFGVSAGEVHGGSIHRFHRDPAAVQAKLADPEYLPNTAQFAFGHVKLRALLNALRGPDGRTIGYSATVEDVTDLRDAQSAAKELSASLEGMSTTMAQLESSIGEISENTGEAAQVARDAVDAASVTAETMHELGSASTEISAVLKLISSIAEQTNLLALNATIEAARAGEAGRGFAVVAGEVKELAKSTTSATSEIEQQVTGMQGSVDRVVASIDRIQAVIQQIDEFQTAIAAAVDEQTASTQHMARNIVQASEVSRRVVERSAV